MSRPKFLLNPANGAVVVCTDLLLKMRKGYIACEEDGTPLGSYSAGDDVGADTESPFLLNPTNGAVMPWSLLLANKEGMIPCNSQEHANSILLNLGRDDLVPGGNAPVDDDAPETEVEVASDEPEQIETGTDINELVDVKIPEHIDKFTNKKNLVKYAKDNFNETLDARVNLTMLKEQVAMLELNAQAEEEDISKLSMA